MLNALARLAASVLAMASIMNVSSADAAVDFQGKTITIYTGYGVGGSYYFYAQLFAHNLGRHLPGQPTIIIQSEPGAGGVRMLNEAAVRMRSDGTNIFMPPDTMVVTQLLQPEGLAYDARKFRYIGTADQQNTFWVLKRSPYSSLEGMRLHDIFMSSSGKGSTGYMIPALAGPLLGLKIKPVSGYDSSREMILAIEKGEADGTLQAWQVWKQSRPDWFKPDGYGVPLIQIGVTPDPDAPATPLLRDLVRPEDRSLAGLFDTIGVIGRGLAAPPGTSNEVLAVLRTGFQAMLVDPTYVDEAKRGQLRVLPKSGEELEQTIADTFSKSDASVIKRGQALTQ
jgi:tripartite-type tricarboxylate transporter receptor subunit TctC